MTTDRRVFLKLTTAGVGAALLASSPLGRAAKPPPRIRAVAFDAFPVFDPRPIGALAEELFPGKGPELMSAWRTRQFEYTWLRTLSHHYVDFWRVTEDALVFAATATKIALGADQRDRLMEGYLALKAWPDVRPALEALTRAGLRMAFLSNFSARMLDAAVKSSGLDGFFEGHLTTDRVRAYKPDPRAYQMGIDAFKLRREEIAFVASASWDAAGAKWFGYPTIWIDRMGVTPENVGVLPDATGKTLADLVDFVTLGGASR